MDRDGDTSDTSAGDASSGDAWWNAAARAGNVGLWRWSPHDDELRTSPSVAALLRVEGTLAPTLDAFLEHVDGREGLRAALDAVARDGAPLRHRFALRRGKRWLEARGSLERDGRLLHVVGTLIDVSSTVALEARSSLHEERLRAITSALPGLGLVLDETGRYCALFAHDESLLAADRATLIGRRMHDVLPPATADALLAEIHGCLADQLGRRVEYDLLLAGRPTRFEARVGPLPGGWGGERAVVWIANDISDRHRAEHALRRSEARYRAVVNLLDEALLIVRRDGTVAAANRSATELLRSTEPTGPGGERMVRDPAWDAVDEHGDPLPHERYPAIRTLTTGERIDGEIVGIRFAKDGALRWFSVRAMPLREHEDDPVESALVALVDVTSRRRAERALFESESHLRSIIDHANVALWRIDLEGRIVLVGGQVVQRLGYDTDAVLGQQILDVAPASTRPMLERAIRGEELHFDLTLGDVVLQAHYTPLRDSRGQLVGCVGVAVDVSDLTSALRELEAKNAELERFGSTISHDLKTPLVAIRGFVELLARDIERGDHERVQRDLTHIANSSRRMHELLDGLLEFSRADRLTLPQRVPFDEIVREALAQLAEPVRAAGATIQVAPTLPEVFGDRTRLVQVVHNLVDNALRHGGREAPTIEIGHRAEDDALFVRDWGVGVAPRHHASIFGLFERLGTTPGTGVGLPIAQRIVEAHRGRLWVESSGIAGEGTTFAFTLALAPAS